MKEDHDDLCVGIDLGTTNSVLSIINVTPSGSIVSKVVDISRYEAVYTPANSDSFRGNTQKKPLLPSCVFYREDKSGLLKPIVGDFAKRQYSTRPQFVSRSIKSQMGQANVVGLSDDISDKTPEAISAQILRHMLADVKRVYKKEITDAIITVPASFDAAMCQATLKAGELAGIQTKNADGSKRQILLSEPSAVMFDLLNQIQRGEIPSHILDTTKKQKVLVFDIGGGTLDITLHEISSNEKNKEFMQMDEIAINRYTRLGGDDFDKLLADEMFKKYRQQYQKNPNIVQKINATKTDILAQLITYAENLKIDINDQVANTFDDSWGDEKIESPVGGSMHNGYAYDDIFAKEDFEKIVSPFMGNNLQYDDYKRIETITDDLSINSIIYPVLDVLKKASIKLDMEDVKVDAVVINGGMSKLYLIQERLEKFFGFKPIIALDPDQAVARGAAVYHYYLHKYGENDVALRVASQETNDAGIQLRKTVLNDALYLGTSGGAHELLVDAGTDLPFKSEIITGFSILPKQSKIKIPIRKKETWGDFVTIAIGEIIFERTYKEGAEVSIRFSLSKNKILSFEAKTEKEVGTTTILIDRGGKTGSSSPLVMPKQGSRLLPNNEISRLRALCNERRKAKSKSNYRSLLKKQMNNILHCGNPEDFALLILKELKEYHYNKNRDDFFAQRLLVIARKLFQHWPDEQKRQIADCCNDIIAIINNTFLEVDGERRTTVNEAIRTFGFLSNEEQVKSLKTFHGKDKRYEESLVYAHAVSQTEIDWLLNQLSEITTQMGIWGIGVALKRNGKAKTDIDLRRAVEKIIELLASHSMNKAYQASALLSLGLICDQRSNAIDPLSKDYVQTVGDQLENIMQYYEETKALQITRLLMKGEMLDDEDEKYLLQKTTDMEDDDKS